MPEPMTLELLLEELVSVAVDNDRGDRPWSAVVRKRDEILAHARATLAARDDQQTIDEERATLAAIAQFAKAHGWTDAGEAPSLGEYIRLALAASVAGPAAGTDDGQGYGNCPVQITGEVGGHQFYFRARGTQFTLSFGPEGDTDEYAAVIVPPFLHGTIDREFAAGWMPHTLAKALTDWGCAEFLAEKNAALAASARGAA